MRKTHCVSTGHETIVSDRIKEINGIIKKNSTVSIKEVVKKIANVSMGAWYNYFSKGALRGKISNTTVTALKRFLSLPEDVFAGKGEFTNEQRDAIASKIKEVFGSVPKVKKTKNAKEKKANPENKKTIETAKPKIAKAGRPRTVKEPVERENVKTFSSIETKIREFAHEIDGMKELKQMNGLSEALVKLSNVANKKLELLAALQDL